MCCALFLLIADFVFSSLTVKLSSTFSPSVVILAESILTPWSKNIFATSESKFGLSNVSNVMRLIFFIEESVIWTLVWYSKTFLVLGLALVTDFGFSDSIAAIILIKCIFFYDKY